MIDKIKDWQIKKFFESKTKLPMTQLTRYSGHATVICDADDGKNFVTFHVTDNDCVALPKERLGNMKELWINFVKRNEEMFETANNTNI